MREREVELLSAAITKVNGHRWAKRAERSLNAFLSMKGDLYEPERELMIIGRAVNDWRTRWKSRDSNVSPGDLAIKALKDVIDVSGCPMLWVVKKWNGTPGTDPYRVRTSAFWRVAKKTVQGLKLPGLKPQEWPSHLIWSNLYKIALKEGNPTQRLKTLQYRECSHLLQLEIETLRPKRILFLTGLDWAKPFLKDLGIAVIQDPELLPVEGVGSFNGSVIAICPHPQGKKEDELVLQVTSHFRRNPADRIKTGS